MPKGAALGYVIPSFPAFSLWFCVGFWQLQAVVGWTTKLSMCFWKCTHIHMYTYIYVAAPQCTCMFPPVCAWPCTAAFSAAEELQGAKVQVSEVGWRGCSSRTCRNEPLCVCVVCEYVHSLEHRRMTGVGLSSFQTSLFFVQTILEEGLIYSNYRQQIAIHSSCSFLLLMR